MLQFDSSVACGEVASRWVEKDNSFVWRPRSDNQEIRSRGQKIIGRVVKKIR